MKRQASFHLGVLTVLAGVALLAAGCGSIVVGSGELVTREYDFHGFSRLDVSQQFEVEVTRGATHTVSVTVDDNLVERLRVRLDGDTLRIGLEGATAYQGTTQRATVMLPELAGVELSGASRGSAEEFDSADALQLRLSGASSLVLTDVRAGDLDVEISGASKLTGIVTARAVHIEASGASRIELGGSGGDASLEASGASSLELGALELASARVSLSGASRATVLASGKLDADLSGASSLSYAGHPSLGRVETSGASQIRPLAP